MGEWKEYRLGDVVDIGSSKRIFYEDYVAEGVPFYRSKEVIERAKGNSISTELFITEKKFQEISKKYGAPEEGDLLLTSVGTLGVPYIVGKGERFYFKDGNLTWFRSFKKELSNRFLLYWLHSPVGKSELDMASIGSTQAALTIDGLKRLELRLPEPAEQEGIVGVLSSLDAKVDLLHRQNKTLEAMAEALFRQWFVEEAEETWPWEQLSSHVEVLRGLSYNGAGLCEKGEGVPMHNLNSIYEGGGYKYDGVKYYKGEYKDRHIVLPGDVLVANTEQGHDQLLIGCPAIVPAYFGEAGIFSQHVYKLKLLNPAFSNVFLKHLLLSADVREQLTGSTNGSTVNMLPKDGIEMAKFQMPPKDKIQRFNAVVAPLQEKQEKNYIQIQTLIAQRDTLLPKLMSGEVRVEMQH